jgi:hypothetical protein
VFYEGKEQSIWAKKDEPLSEVRSKIKEKFDLKIEDHNMRIRSYQYYNDVMLDVYEDDKTLEQ